MAANHSFDVTTGVDLQEVDNAVNQTVKEVAQRYDFKGTHCTIEFDRKDAVVRLDADDRLKLDALFEIFRSRLIRRGVSPRNLDPGEVEDGTLGRARRTIGLRQGIPVETSRRIVRAVKDAKFKKVQVAIQGDALRVTAPSIDELQAVIAFLRGKGDEFDVELEFGNFR